MKKIYVFILLLFSYSIGFSNTFSINQFKAIKEKSDQLKGLQIQIPDPSIRMLPKLQNAQTNNYLDSVIHTDGSRKVIQYDNNDQVVDYKYYEYTEVDGTVSLKEHQTWEYDNDGNLVLWVLSEHDDTKGFIIKEKEEYTYDNEGRAIETIFWNYDVNETVISLRMTFSYSGNNLTIENWGWNPSTESFFLKDYQISKMDGDLIVSGDSYSYNEDTGEHALAMKYENTYNDDGLPTYISYKSLNEETSTWEEMMFILYEYNDDGLLSHMKNAMTQMGIEMVISEELYEYNSNEQITLEEDYMMSFMTGQLVKNEIIEYSYNNNVLISQSSQVYDEFTTLYTENNRYEYSFNSNANTANLILPTAVAEYNGTFDFLEEDIYRSGLLLEVKHYNHSFFTGDLELETTATYHYSNVSSTPEESDDATLSDLKIDGISINGFNSTTPIYTIQLAEGTQNIPVVSATATDENATLTIDHASELPGSTTIEVSAEDGTQLTYIVNFEVEKSSDATLSEININGEAIVNFSPSTFEYNYGLQSEITLVPEISATSTNELATVEITQASNISGTATILVTAEDGKTSNNYNVTFFSIANNDASLSAIKVNDEHIDGFIASTYNYTFTMPFGTTAIPALAATATDENALIEISQASELPGSANIVVTAVDGTTQNTYTINFTIEKSNDATLSDIKINGVSLANFDTSVKEYNITLEKGITAIPEINATTSDENASVDIHPSQDAAEVIVIVVSAEDGNIETYTITFSLQVGILDENLSKISAYPNPFNNQLNIDLPEHTGLKSLCIFNAKGEQINKTNCVQLKNHLTIETSELKMGLYFLSIHFIDGNSIKYKILKN